MSRFALTLLAALPISLISGGPSFAGDANAGEKIASRWCVSCHAVGAGRRATDMAPSFTEIANDSARSPSRLRTWLSDPHPPMPNPGLSRYEIEDIIAYLDSLRTK